MQRESLDGWSGVPISESKPSTPWWTSFLPTVLATAFLTTVLVFVFELMKSKALSRTVIWQSHLLIVIFSALVAAALALATLHVNEWMRQITRKNGLEFRSVFEQSPLGIALLNPDGHLIHCNAALQNMLGYSEAELCGKNIIQLAHPDDQPSGATTFRELIDGQRRLYQEEKRYLCANGNDISVRLTLSGIRGSQGKLQSVLAMVENVTEHKQEQDKLRQLSSAVDQSPVSIVITDNTGSIEYVNPKFTQVSGWPAEEVLGKNVRLLKSGDMDPGEYKRLWEAITSGLEWRGELYNRKKNGELYWELASISPIYDETGKIIHFLAVKEDITERKKMERNLAEALDFNEKVLSAMPTGIVAYKASGQCVMANEAAAQTIRATVPQMLKQSFRELESWRASGLLAMAEKALATQKPQEGEFHHVSTFGKEFWSLSRFNCFTRNNEPHLLLTINDFTERRLRDEKIREQAALLDEATDAIWSMDLNERISYWNKGAERIYGWSASDAIGKNPVELLFKGTMTPQLRECIQTLRERDQWTGELDEFAKDGRVVTIQGRSNVIRDAQGHRKSVLIIDTDITEKKKLETQLLRSQRMESIGTLAGGIAHDLNNVLTPLLFSVQMLKQDITDAEGQDLLGTLETNVLRAAKLVKQVLTFGRGIPGERIAIHPDGIMHEIEQIIRETFPKSVEFESDSPPGIWAISGDSTQIHQVLLNLCVNARDAMPQGGKLTIRLENVVLDKTYLGMSSKVKPGPFVLIQVSDTGTGIAQEIQDRIFEPFFTTKVPGHGTGLGLSTTLGIIKSHGGYVNCYSEPGKGATFKVYLPAVVNPNSPEDMAFKQTKLPRGHGELVLLVDDEEAIRKIAQKSLEVFGYRVLLAANGAEALSLYTDRQKEIAVVITDMAMPVMDGQATIVALRSLNPKVKIIGASGLDFDNTRPDATVSYFVHKPYTAENMLRALHKVLHADTVGYSLHAPKSCDGLGL